MSNLSLFDISLEYHALTDLIDNDLEVNEETGEITDNSKELKELFENLQMTFEEKLDNSQKYLLTLKGEESILADEIKRLQAKKAAVKNKQDRLKSMMLNALQASNQGKFKTALYSFNIKNTEAVEIVDDSLLGRSFLRMKLEADKTKIKEALKSGNEVEGARLVQNSSLVVK